MTDTVAPTSVDSPWPVSTLSTKLKEWIDRLGSVWIEGEITQWGVSAGNVYGKLKDLEVDVTVSFNIWSSSRSKVPDDLKQGDRVIALVKPNFWPKGGTLSMQVFEMRHVGLGDLLERLEKLRLKLATEGLFDESRKKPLPFLPNCIGLVTGKDSDAEKDVLRNAQLRWPSVLFRVVHAAVQGDRAVGEVISAIEQLDADPVVDVIIVARGGGDFQHLLVFSDEALVRVAANCVTPLVSAIGHENDRPLLDFVADLRASTPTDAAKRVVPDVAEELNLIRQAKSRLGLRLTSLVNNEIDKIGQLRSRPVLVDSSWIFAERSEEVTRFVARGAELMERALERAQSRTNELASKLHAISPTRTLERGYAIAQLESGEIIRKSHALKAGTGIRVTLADGSFGANVNESMIPQKGNLER